MKAFISADMEGVCGIASSPMTDEGNADYGRARELMTGDVNAAIEGALAGGASEIWVRDAHGSASNLLVEKVQPPAHVVQGWSGVALMMEGVDESCDAALLVGYHARSMTPAGTISHTMTGQTRRLWYNGVELGEYGVSAAHAGHYGVPTVFASGDEALCGQVQELLGAGVETACVKFAQTRQCARMLPLEEGRGLIRQGVAAALGRTSEIEPFRLATPVELRLQLQHTGQADAACLVPTVERVDEVTVVATVPDAVAAASLLAVLLVIA